MKKTLALALCGLALPLLTGCDVVDAGPSGGPSATIESITLLTIPVTALDGQTDLFIAIQDASGRALYESEVRYDVTLATLTQPFMTGHVTLRGHEVERNVVVIARNDDGTNRLIAASEGFTAAELASFPHADVTLVGAGYGGPASMAATLHVGDVAE
ncbi:MAG TPA: hypothetical protein VD962_01370 [Rubricoccaceae bacterium]|nr:hypothetical protein [Rubricoccaceae bacterium]